MTIRCSIRDKIPPEHITISIGHAVPLWKKLTKAEAKAPMAIWIQPNRADVLPARLLKGVKATAEVFGKIKP